VRKRSTARRGTARCRSCCTAGVPVCLLSSAWGGMPGVGHGTLVSVQVRSDLPAAIAVQKVRHCNMCYTCVGMRGRQSDTGTLGWYAAVYVLCTNIQILQCASACRLTLQVGSQLKSRAHCCFSLCHLRQCDGGSQLVAGSGISPSGSQCTCITLASGVTSRAPWCKLLATGWPLCSSCCLTMWRLQEWTPVKVSVSCGCTCKGFWQLRIAACCEPPHMLHKLLLGLVRPCSVGLPASFEATAQCVTAHLVLEDGMFVAALLELGAYIPCALRRTMG
jgi:hypothetical protein